MNPQTGIFHQCYWEALENSGYNPATYNGDIGLYAGTTPNPFWELMPLKQDTAVDSQSGAWQPEVKHW